MSDRNLSQLDAQEVERLRGHLRDFVSGVKARGYPFVEGLLTTHHAIAHRDKIVPDVPGEYFPGGSIEPL